MNSEEEIIIAFVFKRVGKPELEFTNFYLTLSMDLNWFTPEDAKIFIENAIKENLVIKEKGGVKPTFDIEEIQIPLGFYPSKDLFKKVKAEEVEKIDVLKIIIKKIVKESNIDEKTVIKQIKEIEKEKNLTSEVAALLVGKEYDVDLEDFLKDVEKELFK